MTNEYGLSATTALTFEIEAVNDAPVVATEEMFFELKGIRRQNGSVDASDVDGDTLAYSVATAPEHGTLAIDDTGAWVYSAEGSYMGEDSAVITVDDGNGGTADMTLRFSISGYVYEGRDLIIDEPAADMTLMMEGVDKNELAFVRSGDDLAIRVRDEATVTLKNYFVDPGAGVGSIETAQGAILLSRDVISNVPYGWRWFGNADSKLDQLIDGSAYADFVNGGDGNDILFGEKGSDWLSGLKGNDTLIGGKNSDVIYGGRGADTIYGDGGSDMLYGGGSDMLYGGGGADALIGGEGHDLLFGGDENDWLWGDGGDDLLHGDGGNDTLLGGLGNDTVDGDEGDDTLSAGTGNDILEGGTGNDLYLFEKGDGHDVISDHTEGVRGLEWLHPGYEQDAGNDTIRFGEGIAKEDVSFTMSGSNLCIRYGEGDVIMIRNQDRESAKIERIEFADGNFLTNDDIDLLIQQTNTFGDGNEISGDKWDGTKDSRMGIPVITPFFGVHGWEAKAPVPAVSVHGWEVQRGIE